MSTLVYMKILEQSPASYDRWMRVLTLGRADVIRRRIVEKWIAPGDEVLEIGCGTGALTALACGKGARVTAIDLSEKMLCVARSVAPDACFHHLTALELDHFSERRFTKVVAAFSLSEMSETEMDMALDSIHGLLAPGGILVVADEVVPQRIAHRIISCMVRLPISAAVYIATQQTTRPLSGFKTRLEQKGFVAVAGQRALFGTLALYTGVKQT